MVVGADGRTDGQTDRQTDGRTDTQNFGGYNIIPRHFLVAGHKNFTNTPMISWVKETKSHCLPKRTLTLVRECRLIQNRTAVINNWSYDSYMNHLMTKPTKWHVRPAKTQISLGICPVWSDSSLSAWRKFGSLATHWAHSEDWSDWADA